MMIMANDISILTTFVFVLRGLAMRILSVCPSVCQSVKRVDCDKTEERSVQIFHTIRKIIYPSG